jgi:hypothetical protein
MNGYEKILADPTAPRMICARNGSGYTIFINCATADPDHVS